MPRPGFYYYQNERAKRGILLLLGLLCILGAYRLFSSDYIFVIARYIQAYRIKVLLWLAIAGFGYWFLGQLFSSKKPAVLPIVLPATPHSNTVAHVDRLPEVIALKHERDAKFTRVEPFSEDSLYNINPFGFEKLVANLLRLDGKVIDELGEDGPDDGIDLVIKSELPVAVQCKKYYKNYLGVADIRQFVGAMSDQGFTRGLFVTYKGYTQPARQYAARNNVQLWILADVKRLITKYEEKFDRETAQLMKGELYQCEDCNERMNIIRIKSAEGYGPLVWRCRRCSASFPFLDELGSIQVVANT